MPVTEQTYQAVALEDPEGQWELHRGRLREKPAMTASHNQVGIDLAFAIMQQLDRSEYTVRVNSARAKRSHETYDIPDVLVVPTRLVAPRLGRTDTLEVYEEPLPLVAEIWSPSTGGYDVEAKFPAYRERGDAEIWRLHPFEQRLTIWRRQPDGNYEESSYRGGTVQLHALPSATIHIDELFVPD
ncbi:MAG: putative restriction endonuclease [Thermomicrobiales bacterium]|nr:putative restriction endonuclease [Thermomicrobiales bacterium]